MSNGDMAALELLNALDLLARDDDPVEYGLPIFNEEWRARAVDVVRAANLAAPEMPRPRYPMAVTTVGTSVVVVCDDGTVWSLDGCKWTHAAAGPLPGSRAYGSETPTEESREVGADGGPRYWTAEQEREYLDKRDGIVRCAHGLRLGLRCDYCETDGFQPRVTADAEATQ